MVDFEQVNFCWIMLFSDHVIIQKFKRQPYKMVKHTQTIRVFHHFVELALKRLIFNLGYNSQLISKAIDDSFKRLIEKSFLRRQR